MTVSGLEMFRLDIRKDLRQSYGDAKTDGLDSSGYGIDSR